MTEESAGIMRAAAENSGRMSVLVPLCVAQFTATNGAMARFKTSSVYVRENLVSEVVKTLRPRIWITLWPRLARAASICNSQRRRRRVKRPAGLQGALSVMGGLTISLSGKINAASVGSLFRFHGEDFSEKSAFIARMR